MQIRCPSCRAATVGGELFRIVTHLDVNEDIDNAAFAMVQLCNVTADYKVVRKLIRRLHPRL
jgi:hypothetical protein